MMLDDDVRIVAVNEDNTFNPDTAERKAIIRVTFRVGPHGPFVERFPKDAYTKDTRDDRLNAFAREVR
jgi:hypothetical protein